MAQSRPLQFTARQADWTVASYKAQIPWKGHYASINRLKGCEWLKTIRRSIQGKIAPVGCGFLCVRKRILVTDGRYGNGEIESLSVCSRACPAAGPNIFICMYLVTSATSPTLLLPCACPERLICVWVPKGKQLHNHCVENTDRWISRRLRCIY